MSLHAPDLHRVTKGHYGTPLRSGNNGLFMVPNLIDPGAGFVIICSDGMGWEHVSVSLGRNATRTPTWQEMVRIKDLFWDPEDAVMQLHPPASEYVNHHPHCLHLWRPTDAIIPLPPSLLVGPKKASA